MSISRGMFVIEERCEHFHWYTTCVHQLVQKCWEERCGRSQLPPTDLTGSNIERGRGESEHGGGIDNLEGKKDKINCTGRRTQSVDPVLVKIEISQKI